MSGTDLAPGPPRSPESSDWRFAVLVLLILLLATIGFMVVLYIRDGGIPKGIGALGGGITGALIVIIGKRTL